MVKNRCLSVSFAALRCSRNAIVGLAVFWHHIERNQTPMGKGNNSQKNDKKNKKPKQDKAKTVVKK